MPQSQKYYAEWNNHFCAAHKGDFFTSKQVYPQLTKYKHNDVCESIDSDDTNLSSIGVAEKSFLNVLNAYNSRLTGYKNVGPKTWNIYYID